MSQRFIFTSIVLLALAAAAAIGCNVASNGPEGICSPGETQACLCADGADGVQVCAEDSSKWEGCTCTPANQDTDSPSDADSATSGTDSASDSSDTSDTESVADSDSTADTGAETDSTSGDTATETTTGKDTTSEETTDSESSSETDLDTATDNGDTATATNTESDTGTGDACVPSTGHCCVDGDCEGNASCDGDGTCHCKSSWYGTKCNVSFVPVGYASALHTKGQATAISGDGLVVAGWSSVTSGAQAGISFRWEDHQIEKLESLSDSVDSVPASVNYDGSVIVGDTTIEVPQASPTTVAFKWQQGMGTNSLGLLSYGTYSHATAVNNSGTVVAGNGDYDNEPRGIRWQNDSPSALSYDFDPFFPSDISGDGAVLAGKWGAAPALLDFSSNAAGTPAFLVLPSGQATGTASCISDDGQVAAGWLGANTYNSYRWDGGAAPVHLGDIEVLDINGDGSVIVGTYNNSAMIWDSINGLQPLSTLLENNGVQLAGWRFSSLTGVSTNGKRLAGYGWNGDREEGFWLEIP